MIYLACAAIVAAGYLVGFLAFTWESPTSTWRVTGVAYTASGVRYGICTLTLDVAAESHLEAVRGYGEAVRADGWWVMRITSVQRIDDQMPVTN